MPAHENGYVMDDDLVEEKDILEAIENNGSVTKELKIANTDRATFGRLSGVIAKKYGDGGFKGHIQLNVEGSAG